MSSQHNLDIHTYKIEEIYGLFDMDIHRGTPNDLRQAKRKMQNTHPDKSHLDPAYFQFYQKAYQILEHHYMSCHAAEFSDRRLEEGQHNQYAYDADDQFQHRPSTEHIRSHFASLEPQTQTQTQYTQSSIGTKIDMKKFNEYYEEYNPRRTVRDNSWFTSPDKQQFTEAKDYNAYRQQDVFCQIPKAGGGNNNNNNNRGGGQPNQQRMDQIRQQQQKYQLTTYRGFQAAHLGGAVTGSAASVFDEDEQDVNNQYVSSADPFAKFKFEDVRRVHQDETVFTVSESQYDNMRKFNSVEEYQTFSQEHTQRPRTREEIEFSEQQIREAEIAAFHRMKREEAERRRVQENEQRNQSFLSKFLRLGN